MVMEFCTGDLLSINLQTTCCFSLFSLRFVSPLEFSFELGLICYFHLFRDLKPHNLLMDRKTMMLKIADLGLARAFTVPLKKYTHEVVNVFTFGYELFCCF